MDLTLDRHTLVDEVDSAQIAESTNGDLVIFMRIDPTDARSFDIAVLSPRTAEVDVAYTQDPSEIGPLLARLDRTYLRCRTPPDWVLVADSFLPLLSCRDSRGLTRHYPNTRSS